MKFPQRRPARGDAPQTPAVSIRVAALRLLGRREYTAAELADKLEQRGYDAQAIAELAVADTAPFEDSHATAHYRRTVGRRIFARTLGEALQNRQAA
jgi:SOS response regulatory protein OraA/RecX